MAKKPINSNGPLNSDIEGCRAVLIVENNIAECQLVGPNTCSYALPFGYCFLCQHPRLNEILENSNKHLSMIALQN
jgi:hypothetical protein